MIKLASGASLREHNDALAFVRQIHVSNHILVTQCETLLLLPRPAAHKDGILLLIFKIPYKAAVMTHQLISQRRIAVILDIDNTLIESEVIGNQAPSSWTTLEFSKIAHSRDDHGDAYAAQQKYDGMAENSWAMYFENKSLKFVVRHRPGWECLRAFLRDDRFHVSYCSLGLPSYIAGVVTTLDPDLSLIDGDMSRVVSARKDRVGWKSPCIALNVSEALDHETKCLRMLPLLIVDDTVRMWIPDHHDSCYPIKPYAPTLHPSGVNDSEHRLDTNLHDLKFVVEAHWCKCYGETGDGGAIDRLTERCCSLAVQLLCQPLNPLTCLNELEHFFYLKSEKIWSTVTFDPSLVLTWDDAFADELLDAVDVIAANDDVDMDEDVLSLQYNETLERQVLKSLGDTNHASDKSIPSLKACEAGDNDEVDTENTRPTGT